MPLLDELTSENERLRARLSKTVEAAYKRTAEAYPQVTLSSLASSVSDAFAGDDDAVPLRGATDLQGPEAYPDGPDRAIGLVSELKGSASLFAAFAFGALNLPGALTISESRVTSATSSVSTSRPVPESDLLQAFVVLDAATFAFMLVCVVVCQQLLFRLSDGSYARSPYSTDGSPRDPRDSALGVLATQYALEFRTARFAFGLGLVSILLATVVKTWAIFDSSVALPVTEVVGLSSACIGFFYVRNARAFRPIDAPPPGSTGSTGGDMFTQAGAAGAVALALWVASLAAGSLSGAPGVTAERGFQNVVASMEKAAADKADAATAAAENAVAERAAELRVVEARAAAEQAIGERKAAERLAAEKRAASSMAMGEAEAARIYAQAAANTAKIGVLPGLEGAGAGADTAAPAGATAGAAAGAAASSLGMADAAAGKVELAEKEATAAAEASASADKAVAKKAVAEQVAVERLGAAEKAAIKASAARVAADKVAAEKANTERAAGASMRAAADRAESERLQESLARARAQAAAAAASAQKAAIEAKAQADSAIEEALSKAQEAKEAPAMIQEAAAAAARKAAADAQVASETALAAAQAAVEAARVAPAQMAAEADAAVESAAVDVDVIAELRQRLRL